MFVVFPGSSGSIEYDGAQAFALGVLETIHEFLEFIFHLITSSPVLPTSRSPAAARIASAKPAEAPASTTASEAAATTPASASASSTA